LVIEKKEKALYRGITTRLASTHTQKQDGMIKCKFKEGEE
jgi:hypothetical protein